jgi:hypothetical protein
MVVTKFASSPIAAAISFRVSRTAGAESIRLDIAVFTKKISILYVMCNIYIFSACCFFFY